MLIIKKIIILVFTLLVITGCEERPSKSVDGVDIVTIDSCEYIRSCTYMGYCVYSPKANCRFCEKRKQKELKELKELIIKLKEK